MNDTDRKLGEFMINNHSLDSSQTKEFLKLLSDKIKQDTTKELRVHWEIERQGIITRNKMDENKTEIFKWTTICLIAFSMLMLIIATSKN